MSRWSLLLLIVFSASICVQFGRCIGGLDVPELANLPEGAFNFDEHENKIKEKCEKNGGKTAYDNFAIAKEKTQFCFSNLINVTLLQSEIEAAKPTGDLDIVFSKYCRKRPIFDSCLTNFTTAVEPCLDKVEKEFPKTAKNISDALLDFICFKDGDKIALFIAEGGPSCLSEHNVGIQACVNATLGKYTQLNQEEVSPFLKFEEEQCQDVKDLQKCVVDELSKCEEPTTANIIDSLINFATKRTNCVNVAKKPKIPSAEKIIATPAPIVKTTAPNSGSIFPPASILNQSFTDLNATHILLNLQVAIPRH